MGVICNQERTVCNAHHELSHCVTFCCFFSISSKQNMTHWNIVHIRYDKSGWLQMKAMSPRLLFADVTSYCFLIEVKHEQGSKIDEWNLGKWKSRPQEPKARKAESVCQVSFLVLSMDNWKNSRRCYKNQNQNRLSMSGYENGIKPFKPVVLNEDQNSGEGKKFLQKDYFRCCCGININYMCKIS